MSVDVNRVIHNLKKLGMIGYTDERGLVRLSYSEKFNEGRDFCKKA